MRSVLALSILSLVQLGCGKLDFEADKERPKVEKAFFEKAAIGYRGVQNRTQPEAADGAKETGISDDAYLVTP
jgi:hypothetical protein